MKKKDIINYTYIYYYEMRTIDTSVLIILAILIKDLSSRTK